MDKKKFLLVFFYLLILLSGDNLFCNEDAGTTGFNFLKIMYSARANALGGAFSAVDNTAESFLYNPATLGGYKKDFDLTTTYMNYFDGYNGGSVVLARKYNQRLNYGVFLQYMSSGDITRTIAAENGGYEEIGTFDSSNIMMGINYSYYLNEQLNIGANIKYITDNIDNKNATAIAGDVGLFHRPKNKRIRVAVAIKNIGTQIKYYTKNKYKENLPLTYVAGISYHRNLAKKIKDKFTPNLLLSLDVVMPKGSDMYGCIGAEIQFYKMLIFRLGYKTNGSDWKVGGDNEAFSGFSTGIGFVKERWKIDYSLNSYGDLGFVNQVSIGYSF